MSEGIRKLETAMAELEKEIVKESEKLKSRYLKAAQSIPPDTSYYLIGIQTGSVVKAYHLTKEGVGVQGEGEMPIPEFIDAALRFANYPKRKIEVLGDFAGHLEKIYTMLSTQQAS